LRKPGREIIKTEFYSAECSRNGNYGTVKVKVKVTLEQATKAQRWSRGTAPLFL
jgi:hypothetical protein